MFILIGISNDPEFKANPDFYVFRVLSGIKVLTTRD